MVESGSRRSRELPHLCPLGTANGLRHGFDPILDYEGNERVDLVDASVAHSHGADKSLD